MNTQKNNVWENKANQLQEEYIQNEKVFANASGFPFDIRRIFAIWPFILLFGLLGYAVGNIVLRYSNPVYLVSTSISLEENQEVSIGQVFTGVQKDAFSDRISYFKSPALAAQLVDSLGLQYYAEAQGRFRNKSFYKTIKWQILNQNNNESETSLINFSLVPKVSGFHFISDSIQGDALWGQPFLIHKNMIVVNKLQDFNSESPIYCYNINKMMAAFNLSNGIELQTTKESAIINIKYTDISSERAIDILNGLISLFNHVLEQDKAQGFSQAINFIEQRMKPLRDELDSIENSLAQFKSSQGLGGSISANSEIFLSNIQNYDRQLTQINILENTIKAVESFIQNPTLQDADLAFVGIDNPGLQSILSQYQQMRMQRDKLALTAQESNPTLKLVNKNLADLKSNMENQLQNYKSNLRIAKDTYNEKIGTANSYLRSAPIAEKELIDKTRFQNIK